MNVHKMSSRSGPIRVLWFVNTAFPAVDKYLGKREYVGTGTWMKATIAEITKVESLDIGIAWASDEIQKYEKFEENNISYYLIPQHPLPARRGNKYRIFNKMWRHLNRLLNLVKRHKYSNELRNCVQAVRDFKPDLVHVWGTEKFYGLISDKIDVPVLVRFQGLLSVIKDDFWGSVKWGTSIFMIDEMLSYFDIRKRARIELAILKQNKYFEGRTFWDHSHLREHNAYASYYDIPVIMRPSFYGPKWAIENIKRHSVYATARSMPLKGNDCLLRAISIARQYVPDIQLRIGGDISNSGYGKFLRKMVSDLGLDDCVTFLGSVSEKEIVNEILSTHVYVLPSYIENECNSLIEAQIIGAPCVAAYVGGVTSTVVDGKTGLFFHKGDSATLAMNIRRIFDDETLALRLSENARKYALERFDRNGVVSGILSAYRDILERENHERSVQ